MLNSFSSSSLSCAAPLRTTGLWLKISSFVIGSFPYKFFKLAIVFVRKSSTTDQGAGWQKHLVKMPVASKSPLATSMRVDNAVVQ
jgi:hypothetical protein